MTPPDLIGQRILSVRYHHIPQNPEGLQEFHCYLQLASGDICTIPVWPIDIGAEELLNEEDLLTKFTSGRLLEESLAQKIIGNKITDIYFQKENGFFSKPAFLELENGYYFTEENYSSQSASILILHKTNFLQEEGLNSYLKDLKGT